MRAKVVKKTAKVHANMDSMQFRTLRESMRFSLVELSVVISIPYRTLQDYEYGKRRIPGRVADLMQKEFRRERRIMQQILAGIDKRIEQEFPNGFASEVTRDSEIE